MIKKKTCNLIFYILLLFVINTTAQEINFLGGGQSQVLDPVSWTASVEQLSETEYVLHYKAEIEEDWHIYSQDTKAGWPFGFRFEDQEGNYTLEGKAQESETETKFDEIFEENTTQFIGYTPWLAQKISLINTSHTIIKSEISYQVCKEVCIPQTFYIVHDLKNKKGIVFEDFDDYENYGLASKQPEVKENNKELQEKGYNEEENKGLWTIFILSFLAGLTALLTPCVFPMIPLTVGFFTKQSKNRASGIRNAIFYGISIIAIYVVLGLAVTAIFGADALNAFSTSVIFNITFFIILVIFAISFLGAFEIRLPQSWANNIDNKANKGGLIGIFFMALALAIVSFSCTGPIVGTTLVQAASQGGIAPAISMFGFSSAIAIPFALFAMFPGWLNSLPKSGGWLNSVKVVLGFLELALAFKFLSNADLVMQAHLLEREVFIAIIIAVLFGLTLYLFGQIKLPHDSPIAHISVGRLLIGLLTLSFVVYLIPGLWGAPLKLISGFPPPMNYSESPNGVGGSNSTASSDAILPENAKFGPHDIISFTDYEVGLAFAKAQQKPVFIDFTGHACVNCRRMEERVWADPKILNILKNDVILISLYADAKEKLPESEQYTSETTGKRIRTIGNKWSDFQIERYQVNAQPYYVLMDHEESNLNRPVGYTPDIEKYKAWLKDGIARFNTK